MVGRPLVRRGLAVVHRGRYKAGMFHRMMDRVTVLVTCRMAESVPLRSVRVRAPLMGAARGALSNGGITVVPVLHTKLKVISNFLTVLPTTGINRVKVCHSRRALRPIRCFIGLPASVRRHRLFVISPVLTANKSTVTTVRTLRGENTSPSTVGFVYLITTPRKISTLRTTCPSISVCTTSLSRELSRGDCVLPNLKSTNSQLFNAGW